jgi:signal transduction histidine kinase
MDSAAHPSRQDTTSSVRRGGATPASESSFDSLLLEDVLPDAPSSLRWMGWRLRLLVGVALAGCVALFMLARMLAEPRHVDASWRINTLGQIELRHSDLAALQTLQGRALTAIVAGTTTITINDALLLQRSARWLASDEDRERHRQLHAQLSSALTQDRLKLVFSDGAIAEVKPQVRGYAGLGAMFFVLCALALVVYLIAMVVLLARPSTRNMVYALMALCQSGNLLFIAVESSPGLGLPANVPWWDMQARMAFDLFTAAAIVHATAVHPRPLPHGGGFALGAWVAAAFLCMLSFGGQLPHAWWWTQAGMLGMALLAIALLSWSYRIEPHPYAMMLRRFGIVATAALALLTVAVASAGNQASLQYMIAWIGSVLWYVFLASVLLLVPFLSRSHQVMREFSLLAAISTVATSLDLLFVAVFSLGQFASLTLSLFLALGVYAGARQWILNQVLGSSVLTTERMFERLYRIAREVEARPENTARQLSDLLRDLFEPIEVIVIEKLSSRASVVAHGSTLLVPVPEMSAQPDVGPRALSIVLRFAHRGRRLFTLEDARLTDRVVEQLRRAVAFDKAVEQGRSEERMRLAQDLHDDIGARLLTLMYKAQSPEMEDYVRHTLQDLKTLTRGLAAPNHRLSHAAAEWKADLTQRLSAARCTLEWSVEFDDDMVLTVVQWSALTRVLRELVSNAISHAQATRVSIELRLADDQLDLRVEDNGIGRNPQAWSHGLGLGGVRKRVKQLGGEVEWVELKPQGIGCHVRIRDLSQRH